MSDEIPFRALADYTYDWESWLDASGRVRWVNPAITRLTGYSVEEGLAMPDYPLPLVVPEDRPIMQSVLSRAREGHAGNHVEFRVLQKDGQLRWTAISWQPLEDEQGVPLGVRTSVRDIDQHKQLERALEAALHRAEAANLAKVEFLANVSHELRTPLTSILGYTELLRATCHEPKQKRFLSTIATQGQQLDRLVADLLDFSTLGAGSLPLRPANIRPGAVVREVVRALLPRAQSKGLSLDQHIEHCPLVSMDPARLTQVVSNLIDNAIKYTEAGRVTVRCHRHVDSGELAVTVEDTGPGLPTAVDLFQPFRQGRTAKGGVGLGLAIAARLCRAMGGDLVTCTGEAPGACFRATFAAPLALGEEDEPVGTKPAPSAEPLAELFPLRIMVVDDVASAREFLADALRALGYEPTTAASGEEALTRARAQPPDVTFIDLQMPGQDGWSVARALRQFLGPERTLIGASASHLLADSPGLAAAGFDAFLAKPTPLAALRALLARIATRQGLDGAIDHDASSQFGSTISFELGHARLIELEALQGPDGTSLLRRTLERVESELSTLESRLGAEPSDLAELRRAVHDLAGVFALVGAREAQTLAGQVEDELLRAEPTDAKLAILREGAAQLRAHVKDHLALLQAGTPS